MERNDEFSNDISSNNVFAQLQCTTIGQLAKIISFKFWEEKHNSDRCSHVVRGQKYPLRVWRDKNQTSKCKPFEEANQRTGFINF